MQKNLNLPASRKNLGVMQWAKGHIRIIKVLVISLCVILLLNACIWGLIRFLVPRAAFSSMIRSGAIMTARGTMTAVVGRAASLSLVRGISTRAGALGRGPGTLNRKATVTIKSMEGATLGSLVVRGQGARLFVGNARHPLIKVQRKGNTSTHRNYDGQLMGSARYKNNDKLIEYYDPKNKYLGKDVIDEAENTVTHFNRNNKVIHRSTYKEKSGNEFIYRSIRKFDQELLEMYAKEIALDNSQVSAAYDSYLDYVEQCFQTRNKKTCAKKRMARTGVVTLMEYYGK